MNDFAAKLNIINPFDAKVQNAQVKVENDISQTTFFKQKEEGASDNVKLSETHEKEAAEGKEKASVNLKQLTGAKDIAEKKLEAAKLKGADAQELEKLQKDIDDIQKKIDDANEADKKADERIEEVKQEKIESEKKLEEATTDVTNNEKTIEKDKEELSAVEKQQTDEQKKIDEEVKKEELKLKEEEEEKKKEPVEENTENKPEKKGFIQNMQDTGKKFMEIGEKVQNFMEQTGINPNDMDIKAEDIGEDTLRLQKGTITGKSKGSDSVDYGNTQVSMNASSSTNTLTHQQFLSFDGEVTSNSQISDKLKHSSKTNFSEESTQDFNIDAQGFHIGSNVNYNINLNTLGTFTNTLYDAPHADGVTNFNTHLTYGAGFAIGSNSQSFTGSLEEGANISYRVNDNVTGSGYISNKTGFSTDTMKLTNNFNTGGSLNYKDVLYKDDERGSSFSLQAGFNQGFSLNTDTNTLTNQILWNTSTHTGFSTSMSYQVNPQLLLSAGSNHTFDLSVDNQNGKINSNTSFGSEFFTNAEYQINNQWAIGGDAKAGFNLTSSGDNTYSFGGGVKVSFKPNDSVKIVAGANYTQTGNMSNSNNTSQILGANAGIDMNGIGANVGVDYDLAKNKYNISTGFNFKF